MLVASSFDLWQKDPFFSAAEEIQQSADRMESAYRTWLRARRNGLMPTRLDEISQELQMALGTAKWQLEEFERAVCLSYQINSDEATTARHRQFVSAIEDQISRIETALKESFYMDGSKSFRWVNLNEEECNDLTHFLSGTPVTSQRNKNEDTKLGGSGGSERSSIMQTKNMGMRSGEVHDCIPDAKCFVELQEDKIPSLRDEISRQADEVSSNRRPWNLSDRTALEIVIDSEDRPENAMNESTPKEKGFKPFSWGSRCAIKSVPGLTRMNIINWINQRTRRGHKSQRQQQASPSFPVNSIRFILAFMLTIFLVVPFLLHST